jgi:lipopolysaccharide transport protein LptA
LSAGRSGGWRLILVLRAVLLVLLAASVIAIVFYFLTHMRRPAETGAPGADLPPQKVESQEAPQYREFIRERAGREISAAHNSLGPDGLYHLEGEPGKPVIVIDRGAKGGRDLRFEAERVDYKKDWETATFYGRVSIGIRGVVIQGDAFAYEKAADLVRSLSAVTLRADRFRGQAKLFAYSVQDDSTFLSGKAQLTLSSLRDDKIPFTLFGDRITFNYAQRRARAEGSVQMTHGRSRGGAEAAELQLFVNRDDLHILWLMGGVTASLREEDPSLKSKAAPAKLAAAPAAAAFRPAFSVQSETQDIVADQLMLTAYPDAPAIYNGADGGRTRIAGDAVGFVFDRKGKLDGMSVRGGGEMTALDPGASGERRLSGSPIIYEGSTRVLKAFADGAARAISAEPGREISADWVLIFMQNNNANASGNLTIVVKREPDPAKAEGFFKAGRPAFIRAGFLSYVDKDHSLLVRTAVRMWQDDQVLEAPEALISLDTEALDAGAGVRFLFVQPAAGDRPAASVQVGGERMAFDPAGRTIEFKGKGRMRTRDVELQADSLTVIPDKEPGRARSIRARGGVTIKKGGREAFGEAADYDVEKDVIVLTGRPYLVDKERGTVRGDKLTFRLSDGTIEVENRANERSEIVIKS